MQSDPESVEPAGRPPGGHTPTEPPGASVRQRLAELREFFSYYTAVRIDALKSSVRRWVLAAALALIGLLALAGLVIIAVVLICNGICDALTRLLHSRSLAELLTGALLLICIVAGAYVALGRLHEFWYSTTVAKYEARRQRQKERFGRDVSQAADGNEPRPRR